MKTRAFIFWAILFTMAAASCASPKPTPAVVYSQTSLDGSSNTTPGLYDQLGLTGGPDPRRDFFEIFRNNTGKMVRITRASMYGFVDSTSEAVIVPVVTGMANGIPKLLIPDTDPAHILGSTILEITSGEPGRIDITFSPAVEMPAEGWLAFGVKAPLEKTVDVTFFGTDTLDEGLTDVDPPYWTGFYGTDSFGVLGLNSGKHYLIIEGIPEN